MSRNLKHLHFQAEKLSRGRFFNEEVRLNRFDFQLKSEAAKKFRIGNHWRGERMTTDLASKPVFNFGDVRDVIEMAVRKEQKLWIDIPGDQPSASSVRGVEKNPSFQGLNQIAIRLENAAAKRFVNH